MHDDLFERDPRGEDSRERPERPAESQGPLADREVPLSPVGTSDVVHRWLDGELPEPSGTRESTRAVEFWRRIGEETDRRRQVVTPAYLSAQIMAALPTREAAPTATGWWKKSLHLSPATTLAIALGAFALGVLVMGAVR
jgi:hypothetical protein